MEEKLIEEHLEVKSYKNKSYNANNLNLEINHPQLIAQYFGFPFDFHKSNTYGFIQLKNITQLKRIPQKL